MPAPRPNIDLMILSRSSACASVARSAIDRSDPTLRFFSFSEPQNRTHLAFTGAPSCSKREQRHEEVRGLKY
jgi:hypothetical protein